MRPMDDNDSRSPTTSSADRLNSFHPDCNNLKQQYDQCFNLWFTEHYMNGHYDNSDCQKVFENYTDCVKRGMKEYGLQYDQMSILNFGINQEKLSKSKSNNPNVDVVEEDQRLLQLENSLDIELKNLQEKKKERDKIMKALHHYNDIKDTTQIVLGQLAILEGVTVAEIHRKYNLLESD
ncbi:Mitochondrial distribution/morphology family 35/apoptosis,DNA repair protein, Swi5 [Cinara cedri]|uniref:Mitochondrial distribution/morphology family 35/apoptosis,DNA repair protein, Swi5 n=1 Tax=Cinara cedri TaxID=506608 RepID=A0A5E4NBD9_9HEMI|nr:Mitochondrial distribution/morphology family 35/apoptosis,DNA repair protein, Swi5 [Cinara cedri]